MQLPTFQRAYRRTSRTPKNLLATLAPLEILAGFWEPDFTALSRNEPSVEQRDQPVGREAGSDDDCADQRDAGQALAVAERELHWVFLHLAAAREEPDSTEPVEQGGQHQPE